MTSRFGNLFHVTTFGESHGVGVGCIVDGCPPGVKIREEEIQHFLNRRKPGQNQYTTPRGEKDICEILSGVEKGVSLGTPIGLFIRNQDKKPQDYQEVHNVFRPSHADYTTYAKYGIASQSGGGRASARETIGRIAAAAIAKSFVTQVYPKLEVVGFVQRIAHIQAQVSETQVTVEQVEESEIRCPDKQSEIKMKECILNAKAEGDSLGGMIRCLIRHVPAGLGEPVFDKLEAELAKAMLSLPASKSFEIGSGVEGTYLKGSQHNDEFYLDENKNIKTKTNFSGGIQGGISNGMPIIFNVGFKPVSTIFTPQNTVSRDFNPTHFTPQKGRHDSCVLPRAVPMVEAMSWLVLAEHILRQKALDFKENYAALTD